MLSPSPRLREVVRGLLYYPTLHELQNLRPTAWLDGLRGIAAFEVFLYHFHLEFLFFAANATYGSHPETMEWWRLPFIHNLYHSGSAMVNVFFTISGFVLTQRGLQLVRARQPDKLHLSLSSAVFRRALRLYIPTVVLSFVSMLLIHAGIRDMPTAGSGLSLAGQIVDWFNACREFIQPFHNYYFPVEVRHRYEALMWTLPLEFYGSIVCYITLLAVSRVTNNVKRNAIVLLITWLALIRQNWFAANFLMGMLLADFSIWQDKTQSTWSTSLPAKCFWAVVFVWAFYVNGLPTAWYDDYKLPGYDWYYDNVPVDWKDVEGGARFWWMISGVLTTVAISQLPILKRVCETAFCQYLGRISFMLYLVHLLVFEMFGRPWKNFLETLVHRPTNEVFGKVAMGFAYESYPGMYVVYFGFWIVTLPLVLVASGQVTKYLDEPSVKAAKWLETKFTEDDERDELSIPLH